MWRRGPLRAGGVSRLHKNASRLRTPLRRNCVHMTGSLLSQETFISLKAALYAEFAGSPLPVREYNFATRLRFVQAPQGDTMKSFTVLLILFALILLPSA